MKKIYSFFLLLGLLLSVGNAWGDVVTGTINFGSGAGCGLLIESIVNPPSET